MTAKPTILLEKAPESCFYCIDNSLACHWAEEKMCPIFPLAALFVVF